MHQIERMGRNRARRPSNGVVGRYRRDPFVWRALDGLLVLDQAVD